MTLSRLEFFSLEAPVDVPVRTSFGTMMSRPALLVCVVDNDGDTGWGEIWCNHPPTTAKSRLQLASSVVAPMFLESPNIAADACRSYLEEKTHILSLQCGEPGPYAQIIAGFEAAIWDLEARKLSKPLHVMLGADRKRSVPAYASGINPDRVEEIIPEARSVGFKAFKVKVGFGDAEDVAAVSAAAKELRDGELLMLDVNQGWRLDQALKMCQKLAEFAPVWIEEPLAADDLASNWRMLADASPVPLAGGENIIGYDNFNTGGVIESMTFIQPDVAKWGGISGCFAVARAALSKGKVYCPHFLGAATGLLASAQLLAAAGGDGWLEVDVNKNLLRSDLSEQPLKIENGKFILPDDDGIGFQPNRETLDRFLVEEVTIAS